MRACRRGEQLAENLTAYLSPGAPRLILVNRKTWGGTMNGRFRSWSLPAGLAIACLAFAGSASAAGTPYSGSVANGGCDGQRAGTGSGPARLRITVRSTPPEKNNGFAGGVGGRGKAG